MDVYTESGLSFIDVEEATVYLSLYKTLLNRSWEGKALVLLPYSN
jgi:hypothetical protein